MSTEYPDSHYHLLTQAIPTWLGQASAAKRDALGRAKPRALTASTAQRTELKRLIGEHWQAQNTVDDVLAHLQDPKAFARPILEDALLSRFALDLNADATFLRLYIPQTVPGFSLRTGAARTWTVSLVDAALHNFELSETRPEAYETASTYISQPNAGGQFETLPKMREKLPIASFAQLCRDLDIGARYQAYLREQLGLDEPVAAAALQRKVQTSQRAALRAALQVARIQGDIQEDFALAIEALMGNTTDVLIDQEPLRGHSLSLLEVPLSGVMLFAPDLEKARSAQRVVVYRPDDPAHPLKEYPSTFSFKQSLAEQLREADYQTYFSRFVPHHQRGLFFSTLRQRLGRITYHPPQRGDSQAPWREKPTDEPHLHAVTTMIQMPASLHLYQQALNKILNDARALAVSTASVDRAARWALWDSFVNLAASIVNTALMVVAPFIPGLGELMMGYMAYQLLDEVFEGIVDWAEGLSDQAFEHLMDVMQSLVQLGAFGAGARIGAAELRKVLPESVLKFIDTLKPVTLADGSARYWKPDLAPYQQPLTLPPRLGATEKGLHPVRGELLLPLEGQLYAVQALPGERYVIRHPSRADAYTPVLHHNRQGAWHTELEQPLAWDAPTLLRRLGPSAQDLSEADRALAQRLSRVSDNALRKLHVDGEPLPPLLHDSLARVRIDRQIQTLIERLNSDDPAMHRLIDPQDQLQLLVCYDAWPNTRSIRFLNDKGETTWTFGDPQLPVIQIHEAHLSNGELLMTVLQSLSPEEIRTQFGERASDPQLSLPTRVKYLRKRLGQEAEKQRPQLFDSRYAPLLASTDTPVKQLQSTAQGLPTRIAECLVDHASGAELDALEHKITPERLADLAQGAQQELRINRANEGLHLDAVSSLDNERLALNTLKLLPGWSGEFQLQVRQGSSDAPLWLQVGADDAAVRRSLVRSTDGRYVAYDEKGPLCSETDLYRAILHALPDPQRDALDLQIHQADELRERLRHRPLAPDEVRQALAIEPPPAPTIETLRLLGNDDGYAPNLRHPPSYEDRVHGLFPNLGPEQIENLLSLFRAQPDGIHNRLAYLEQQHRQLNSDLRAWEEATPVNHPQTGTPLSPGQRRYDRQNRRATARQIQDCWRRKTAIDRYYNDPERDGSSLRLDHPVLGDLPQLSASFDHVTLLSLSGNSGTTGTPAFLGKFPNLRHLEVNGIPLGELPPQLQQMPRLTTLGLSRCEVRLSAESQARLEAMSGLQSLVLHGNPLGRTPSVERMPDLLMLDLSDTGIERLPAGLLSRPELQTALLNNNQLRELPEALFDVSAQISQRFDLSANPLSRTSLQRIKDYYQQHGTHWEADAPPVDRRDAQLLYPSLDRGQLNRLIFALPGDLEAGHVELARRAGELHTLQGELAQWQAPTDLAAAEQTRRKAVCRLLERCYRREIMRDTEQAHALKIPSSLMGELPTLSASFDHISSLSLVGNGTPSNLDTFMRSFPALEILDVENVPLGDVPPAVLDASKLTFLSLPRCAMRLSDTSRQALEGKHLLHYLDLSHNPLGQAPDISGLGSLSSLQLQHTGITELPQGLTAFPPSFVDLSNNAIEHLPDALFDMPVEATRRINLSANPLSRKSLGQVKRYCQRTGEYFQAHAPAAESSRAQALFPTLASSEIDRFIFRLPGDMDAVAGKLQQLKEEYQQLTTDLQQWALQVPDEHPILGDGLNPETRAEQQLTRHQFKSTLEAAWRYETAEDHESLDEETTYAVTLSMPVMGDLPPLNARFEHVTAFSLDGHNLTTGVDGTLRCFPNLQTLHLNHCSLNTLPTSIFSMPRLSTLRLADCRIQLTPESARSVGDLRNLDWLNLNNNPLGHAPDVSTLQDLTSLHLRTSAINQVPNGLFNLPALETLDLSNNMLQELPQALLEMSSTLEEESDLSANPWSERSLELLREYYKRTGIDFQVPAARVDAQGNRLAQPLEPMEEE